MLGRKSQQKPTQAALKAKNAPPPSANIACFGLLSTAIPIFPASTTLHHEKHLGFCVYWCSKAQEEAAGPGTKVGTNGPPFFFSQCQNALANNGLFGEEGSH